MNNEFPQRILIFEPDISGHKLEYIHHLFLAAKSDYNNQYIFVINKDYCHNSSLEWKTNGTNIIFDLLSSDTQDKKGYSFCKLLKKKVKFHRTNRVFLISLMRSLPFLPLFFLGKNVKLSGIIYLIYLYRWRNSTLYTKSMDILKYLILSRFSLFHKVFILNDKVAPMILNKLYSTYKFTYLPDPFFPLQISGTKFSKCIEIPQGRITYLHFGALSYRKGTLEILKAIELLSVEERKKYSFIFAGKISEGIKKDFYKLSSRLQLDTNIIIIDKFCTYELLGYLCEISNYILMPYKETAQSSGVIGYAAQFLSPVIAPSEGLIGKLVRRYKLGFCIKDLDPQHLCNFIRLNKTKIISDSYLKEHTLKEFNEIILK